MRNIFFLAALFLAISACKDENFFESSKDFSNATWAYRDSVDFRFSVTDTVQLYNMYLQFAYSDSFPMQNIYLKLSTKFPDGKRLHKVKSFDLFDAMGNPQGKCSGHHCNTKILLQDNAFFNQAGEYVITLEQFTRSENLGGIEKTGLMIEKSTQQKGK